MFGVMDLETGLTEEAPITEPHHFLTRQNNRPNLVAVPKDYINSWKSGYKCDEEGCFKDGEVECRLPDVGYPVPKKALETIEHFCQEHAYKNGYCSMCGDFWGGIESFDFNNPSHLCENCLEQVKTEIGEYDEIEEYDGSEYGI